MTAKQLIPVHREVRKLAGVTNIELGEALTFEKNGHKWAVFFYKEPPFVLIKDGRPLHGFYSNDGINKFFNDKRQSGRKRI